MKLIIAEKTSVGRTIASVLGVTEKKNGYLENADYIVSWCRGHLAELAMPEAYDEKYSQRRIEDLPILPQQWKFVVRADAADQYKVVKALMLDKRVEEIICATDAGREGECIFRYVYNLVGCQKPVKRLWTSSLEESAIRKGFAELKLSSTYDNLFTAGISRAKADWLIGMNGSRLFSAKYRAGISVGRVQTPTLAMIVQRDYDVKHFVKKPFYVVELDCGTLVAASPKYDEQPTAEQLRNACDGQTATVTEVTREQKTINSPKLYDLTTLQREANRQFGYTAQQTLDYAQSLYEAKLLTYPRTDSNYITEDMEQTAESMVSLVLQHIPAASGVQIAAPNVKRCINNAKVSDHHALLPTAEIAKANLDELPDGERNLLYLVAIRLLCAVSEPHRYEAVTAVLRCAEHDFTSTGKTVQQDGWKALDKALRNRLKHEDADLTEAEETPLPQLTEGQHFDNVKAVTAEKFSSPPKPYTEDTLLSAMEHAGNDAYEDGADVEKKGIGTPATRAAVIEGLVKRAYIERKKKQILPTEKGISLIGIVPESLKSPKTTAEWETVLQHIERGTSDISADGFLDGITAQVRALLQEYGAVATAEDATLFRKERESLGVCPKCGKQVVEFPKSYSCESGKDGCGFVIWKSICGKAISPAQAEKLLEKKKTDLIKGFTSKTGKPFEAYLILKPDFSIGYEFTKKKGKDV